MRRAALLVSSALFAATVSCAPGEVFGPVVVTSGGHVAVRAETRATDFAVRDTRGRTLRLSDYLGRDAVLLDFWATYCEPCLAEMPHLEHIYEANVDKGFVVIALSMDGPETVAEVRSFARRNGLTFPVGLDEDSHASSIYNPKKSAPLSVLIDKQGNVVRVREGYNPGDEVLVARDVSRAAIGEALE